MAPEKEKPTVETVQQAVKVSDLLMFDVCEPLKEKLDRIELCSPYIISTCSPNISCIPKKLCTPVIHCVPYDRCIPEYVTCVPDKLCKPIFACVPENVHICKPDIPVECSPSAGKPWGLDPDIIKQRLLESDYVKLQAEVKSLKAEVEALKKRLK
jgi:hypothetical protein